jgi:hypothetical protein
MKNQEIPEFSLGQRCVSHLPLVRNRIHDAQFPASDLAETVFDVNPLGGHLRDARVQMQSRIETTTRTPTCKVGLQRLERRVG